MPLSHEVVYFQMLDFETSNSKSEVSKSNSSKITSFSKTTSLQRVLFLTMFYTINLSPLLVFKKGFMLITILSNYQQCPLPLRQWTPLVITPNNFRHKTFLDQAITIICDWYFFLQQFGNYTQNNYNHKTYLLKCKKHMVSADFS